MEPPRFETQKEMRQYINKIESQISEVNELYIDAKNKYQETMSMSEEEAYYAGKVHAYDKVIEILGISNNE